VPELQRIRPDVPVEMANEKEHRRRLAERANAGLPTDGSKSMQYPLPIKEYTVAGLPDASNWIDGMVYVSNESGGATIAFSDGANWRRVQDRAVVS
jgi:hypothetical protein